MTETLIEVAQVSKSYTAKEKWLSRNQTPTFAVRDVSLKIKQGRNIRISRRIGKWKNDIRKIDFTNDSPTEGLINYRDVDIRKLSKKRKTRIISKDANHLSRSVLVTESSTYGFAKCNGTFRSCQSRRKQKNKQR